MKKGFIAAVGLFFALGGNAQDAGPYIPGTGSEGVVYYLPKTEIELQVTATRVNYTPGELCRYADRYLRLKGISAQAETYWEINGIRVSSTGVPDPDNACVIKLKDKSVASQVELTPDGLIKSINTPFPTEKESSAHPTEASSNSLNPRNLMTEEMLQAGSTAKLAELAAREIYSIRESKNSLTRGQADYMPADGAALTLMLNNLEEQEQALTQLFAGTVERMEKVFIFRIEPENNLRDSVVFRFSKKLGILDADNLAGDPYYLSVTDKNASSSTAVKEKKKGHGVIYNIPGKAQVTVYTSTRQYFDGELPVTQFGTTEVLVDNLFNKKVNTRVIFNPDTGSIVKIDKD